MVWNASPVGQQCDVQLYLKGDVHWRCEVECGRDVE